MKRYGSVIAVAVVLLFGMTAFAQTTVESGKFSLNQSTPEYNLHQNTGERTLTIEVKFTKKFETKPEILLGVNAIDADNKTNLRYQVEVSFVSNEGFLLKVKTWADSKVYAISGSWMAIATK